MTVGQQQSMMESEMQNIQSTVNTLNTKTEKMLGALGKINTNARSNRYGILTDMTTIEDKMKKGGFNLSHVQVCVTNYHSVVNKPVIPLSFGREQLPFIK